MHALKLENVSKSYKDFKLDNVTFSLPQGSIMGFIGENGAGKTTTINLILDLIKKDSGQIFILLLYIKGRLFSLQKENIL